MVKLCERAECVPLQRGGGKRGSCTGFTVLRAVLVSWPASRIFTRPQLYSVRAPPPPFPERSRPVPRLAMVVDGLGG